MDELSLYILDITMNSVRAGASTIHVTLTEDDTTFVFRVKDDGCGMSEEQVSRLRDPFFTTRKTRKVGLGVPFLCMLADMTGGHVDITSTPASQGDDHGTELAATFGKNHIDFLPLGDIVGTFVTLIQGSPDIHFIFSHNTPDGSVHLDTEQLRVILGDISLAEPQILAWIDGYLREQYQAVNK